MKFYRADKKGSLLLIRVFVEGALGRAYPKLLIDTGSAYTLISQEILESVGCSPAAAKRRQRIITGSGYEIVPVVSVNEFPHGMVLLAGPTYLMNISPEYGLIST